MAPIIDIAIAKSCHDKKRRRVCEPVLVADVTSTGNRYQPLLLRAATSTGQPGDQYWLLSPPCTGARYRAVVQCVVLARSERLSLLRKRNLPEEREAHPRGDPKAQVRSEPIRGLLRGAGANDAQEADVRGVMEVEGA